jgi:sec-independent protein translocase protein TatC
MLSKLRPARRNPDPRQPAPPPEADTEDGHGARMGIFEHLEELRQRVFKALISVALGTGIGILVAAPFLQYLVAPYCASVPDGDCRLNSLGPTGSVVAYFRVALLVGGVIAIPVITYQLLMFVVPGLTRKEKRILLMALPAIFGLFLVGAGFAWFVLMRPALGFLATFQPQLFKPEWTADLYFSFVTSLIFWMGVAFETPLVFFVLSLLGLVSSRPLVRNWRIAVVGASIAAAAITPTVDPVNMFLVMGPLLGLYVLSIFLVMLGRRISRVDASA